MTACRTCGALDHPSGCAQDLPAIAAAARSTCPDCPHPVAEHSSEDEVGCLHSDSAGRAVGLLDAPWPPLCPCTQPGTPAADQ